MNSRESLLVACALVIGLLFVSTSFAEAASASGTPTASQLSLQQQNLFAPAGARDNAPVSSRNTFAFVSNFETLTLEGWRHVSGPHPTVVTSASYSGEPSLMSVSGSNCNCSQTDYASKGFVDGLTSVSFQVAIYAPNASALFGLGSSESRFVALVGVKNGTVVAGKDPDSLTKIEPVPSGTAQPPGWVYLAANVGSNKHGHWMMQVFVDESISVAASIAVPGASDYSDALIETTSGTAYYSDIVVSSTQLATLLPRWNPMEGYGQGGACLCSSLNVNLLPLFYNLSAEMTLSSWSMPRSNILSFQINSLNKTGTITPKTCKGFFQLGVDLNPGGYIAPWYVEGNNCVAHYFDGKAGVSSPPNTNLSLSIIFEQQSKQILFTILDSSISRTFSTSIPYYGHAFDSMFTQLEFQPSGNISIIQDYKLSGQLYNTQITTMHGATEALSSSYMIPWSVDAPPSWDFAFYQNELSGYTQTSA